MATTRLSTKGQVILPKSIRDARAWGPGTEFTVEATEEGVFLRPSKQRRRLTFDEVAGMLRYTGPPKTLQEMDEGVKRELERRRARGRY
ncbi:MAG: AbrB/MazE/SpoVT family DNA-binding domain-containing protein [Acidobacteria bacterium]|nr:AbrB/MazE/SpoVT family DNA-binding domain-containing protein [Acidobacteriota bacterium]